MGPKGVRAGAGGLGAGSRYRAQPAMKRRSGDGGMSKVWPPSWDQRADGECRPLGVAPRLPVRRGLRSSEGRLKVILSARAQLEDLLLSMFDTGELRRALVRMAEELDRALPSDRDPPEAFAHAAVSALIERRLDDAALFDHLAGLRPRREPEITRVKEIWSQRDRRRFVVVYESERPEHDIADIMDGLAEARRRTGDPTLRVVKVYRGSARWVFEGREATARAPLSTWFPRPASIREEPETGERPALLAPREGLSRVAMARAGGKGWSALDRLRLDEVWGEGGSLEFRSETLSSLQSDALERALRVAEILLALPPPPDVLVARRLLPMALDLGGAEWDDSGLRVRVRRSRLRWLKGRLRHNAPQLRVNDAGSILAHSQDNADGIDLTVRWLLDQVIPGGLGGSLLLRSGTTRLQASQARQE